MGRGTLAEQSSETVTLGIDPGLQCTGYGVIAGTGRAVRVRQAGVVRSRRSDPIERRVQEIYDGVREVIEQFGPQGVAVEELYSHYAHPRTAILMGHARGAILLAAAQAGVPVAGYSATQIKKILTGSGRAGKAQVQAGHPARVRPGRGARAQRRGRRLGRGPVPSPHRRQPVAGRSGQALTETRRVITKITGKLVAVDSGAISLAIGPFEYEVLAPEFLCTHLRPKVGEEVTLHTLEYLEGNPMQGRMVPRLVGFRTDVEREFFELFCSVDGVGHKKALRALTCSVAELARAIHQEDAAAISSLPGIGEATSDRVLAKLRRKVAKFALLVEPEAPEAQLEPDLQHQAINALLTLGHKEADARRLLAAIAGSRKKLQTVEDVLNEIYKHTAD